MPRVQLALLLLAIAGCGSGDAQDAGKSGRGDVHETSSKSRYRSIELGFPDTDGDLPGVPTNQVLIAQKGSMMTCHAKGLAIDPDLQGKVHLGLTISKLGKVTDANVMESTLDNAYMERCLVETSWNWEFPSPEGEDIVFVDFPATFKRPSEAALSHHLSLVAEEIIASTIPDMPPSALVDIPMIEFDIPEEARAVPVAKLYQYIDVRQLDIDFDFSDAMVDVIIDRYSSVDSYISQRTSGMEISKKTKAQNLYLWHAFVKSKQDPVGKIDTVADIFHRMPASNWISKRNKCTRRILDLAEEQALDTSSLKACLEAIEPDPKGRTALLPVGAYLFDHGDEKAWVIVGVWEYNDHGPTRLGHIMIWAIDAETQETIAFSRCG